MSFPMTHLLRPLRSLAAPLEAGLRHVGAVQESALAGVGRDVFNRSPEASRALSVMAGRRAQAAPVTLLGAGFIQQLDRVVNPLGHYSEPGMKQAREAFYDQLYRQPDLQAQAHTMLKKWVTGGNDQNVVRDAFMALAEAQGRAATPEQTLVRDLLATRQERWERLAQRFGETAPTHFHLYRGVRGEYAIEEIVAALETPGRKTVTLSHHTVASWTTDVRQARRFADSPAASVIYEADIPMHQTLADKWVDGSGFLMWCAEQQEVMVAARELQVPLDRFEVTFRGKTYGPAQRDDLVRAWRAAHPRAQAA
ncbi:MAG: hypothetical protein VKP62_10255 [Candidatus Sericytochromatia bacterium]|nr:hypothetical protein [Candidatus Sericytochromatia bacterium]